MILVESFQTMTFGIPGTCLSKLSMILLAFTRGLNSFPKTMASFLEDLQREFAFSLPGYFVVTSRHISFLLAWGTRSIYININWKRFHEINVPFLFLHSCCHKFWHLVEARFLRKHLSETHRNSGEKRVPTGSTPPSKSRRGNKKNPFDHSAITHRCVVPTKQLNQGLDAVVFSCFFLVLKTWGPNLNNIHYGFSW